MNLGSCTIPYLEKQRSHRLRGLFLWPAATFYWDACLMALTPSAKSVHTGFPSPLWNSSQRSLRDCLLGYNPQFGVNKKFPFFLGWLLINFFVDKTIFRIDGCLCNLCSMQFPLSWFYFVSGFLFLFEMSALNGLKWHRAASRYTFSDVPTKISLKTWAKTHNSAETEIPSVLPESGGISSNCRADDASLKDGLSRCSHLFRAEPETLVFLRACSKQETLSPTSKGNGWCSKTSSLDILSESSQLC